MAPEQKAQRFPCPGCAAEMVFDPATGGMKCPFCGQTKALPVATGRAAVSPHDFGEFVAAGDNPQHRDVVVVMRQLRQGLERLAEGLKSSSTRRIVPLIEPRNVLTRSPGRNSAS